MLTFRIFLSTATTKKKICIVEFSHMVYNEVHQSVNKKNQKQNFQKKLKN